MTHNLTPGDPLYVSSSDIAVAMSLGASIVEGDSRLRIPSPLPDGVSIDVFSKWTSVEARVTWLSEFIEMISGSDDGILDLPGVIAQSGSDRRFEGVKLFVPRSEMDRVRIIPGVRWSREIGMYVADATASFGLIHPYLTESMRSIWMLDQNLSTEVSSLVKARALVAEKDVEEAKDVPQRELDREEKNSGSED